ncbi:hypothetical protein ABMA32_03535 [Mesorhizobium sp. VNQ89]|uniref:PGN_0703 family putative restriction endonuclease n=1 Tax=Mesorhizobium quangtriensis TaxID=3157709 RepID=UPI0032B7C760
MTIEPSNDTGFVPTVGPDIAKQHHTLIASDDRYRGALRLLAALWREEEGLPIGRFIDREGKAHSLGSRISDKAGRAGRNFMSPAVADLASRELVFRQIGALYDAHRLRTNLLASQTLCLNLFGPAKLDPRFADKMMAGLFPDAFRQVTGISFEFSPGRGDPRFTGDFTAVDIFIAGISPVGERAFIAVEMKYGEGCNDAVPRNINPRHLQIASESGFATRPGNKALLGNPHQQLLREMALMQSMIDADLFDSGQFIVIAPAANRSVANACTAYQEQLAPHRDGLVSFDVVALEQVIEAIAGAGQETYAQRLHARYCDFTRIETLMDKQPA